MKSHWIFLLIFAFLPGLTAAQEQGAPPVITRESAPAADQVRLTEIASGLWHPLYVTHAGDGSNRLFVVEKVGKIWVIEGGEQQSQPFLDVSSLVTATAQKMKNSQGLLGLAFHPDYQTRGQFYINYTDRAGDTVVSRYQVSPDNPNLVDVSSAQIIFRHAQPSLAHNGGHMAFGPDGYFYISLGDGQRRNDPLGFGQNTLMLLGSILRIDVDGGGGGEPYAIPADNPFVGDVRGLDEIWAYGLRNVWRFSFDRQTGDLYLADVGQHEWEEVNFQPADSRGGENYGWNVWEGNHLFAGSRVAVNYAAPLAESYVAPFAEYSHFLGCSVTGGYVYRGAAIADLQGVYLFGDYCTGRVWASWRDSQLQWHTSEFLDTSLRISSFGEDERGELYIVDYIGRVYRLDPT